MSVNLYNTSYAEHSARVYREVRAETYDLDLGQTGWMSGEEFRTFFEWLALTPASRVLEVGCGAGGCALYLARTVGATVTGIDVNENGIRNARSLAQTEGLTSQVSFELADAGQKLLFADNSFDAVFSNDAMCHIPRRLQVLEEWYRVLKPGGRMLFTDALIVTGVLSNEEIATRSSIGTYFFLPPGENERLIEEAGFHLLSGVNVTGAVAAISGRWLHAREQKSQELLAFEGETNYFGLQRFLATVHALAQEERLSRYLYVASKQA
ncbi:MAG: class I SAM-dependent methyltransferase [Bryobacteraceae bacterium]